MDNPNFIKECIDRWIFLRETLLKEEFIFNMLSEMYEDIKDLLNSQTVEDAISCLYEWISERLLFCDNYFRFSI